MVRRSLEDLRRTPAYPFAEAAHYLHMPPTTLRAWCLGQKYYRDGKTHLFKPVIKLDGEPREGLSFLNLIEAHVLAAIRRTHELPLPKVREAVMYVGKHLGVSRPLADVTFQSDGVRLFVHALGRLVNVNRDGQVEIAQFLNTHLHRIERDPAGVPIKFLPFTRSDADAKSPAPVEIDPRVAFGRPVIRGRAVWAEMLAERFKGGDSIGMLADDLELDADAVSAALRFAMRRVA